MSDGEVIIRRDGRAGRITLNRPRALNALTLEMVREIWSALNAWLHDPAVDVVVLDGAGDRGLCAGGDVVSLYQAWTSPEGDALARAFWSEEYRLNALIGRYPKPFVPLMDGVVMGGGIGLSAHARGLRVVTERSRIAYPETTIGLIPDVGGTWLLSRVPAAVGNHVALMGPQLSAAQAIGLGLADRFVASARLPELVAALAADTQPPGEIIANFASPAPGTADLVAEPLLSCFGQDSVGSIIAALLALPDGQGATLARGLERRSPLALLTTFEAVKRARTLTTLEEALSVEYRLCLKLYGSGEFPEGIRALLVDKDRAPRWRYRTLDEVPGDVVSDLFAPITAAAELSFR